MIFFVYVIIFSAFGNTVVSLIGAFILGILKDLWEGQTLGISAFSYILVTYGIHLYKRKFNAHSAGFLFFASLVTIILSELIGANGKELSIGRVLWSVPLIVAILTVWFIVRKIWAPPYGGKKLSV